MTYYEIETLVDIKNSLKDYSIETQLSILEYLRRELADKFYAQNKSDVEHALKRDNDFDRENPV